MRDGLHFLEAVGSHLYHWGLKTVARSNCRCKQTRPVGFFRDMFAEMYALCTAKAPKHKVRCKSKLFSLDSTTIKLFRALFPWASFRQARGGIKMHTLLSHDGHIPAFTTVSDAITQAIGLQSLSGLALLSMPLSQKRQQAWPGGHPLGRCVMRVRGVCIPSQAIARADTPALLHPLTPKAGRRPS